MRGYSVRAETDWGNGTAVIVELDEGGHLEAELMAKLIKELLDNNKDKVDEIKRRQEEDWG